MKNGSDRERVVVPRSEIESLCMMLAIPIGGCDVKDLPGLLGLSPLLAPALLKAIAPLVADGWIDVVDDRIEMTTSGRDSLEERLSEIGVSTGRS